MNSSTDEISSESDKVKGAGSRSPEWEGSGRSTGDAGSILTSTSGGPARGITSSGGMRASPVLVYKKVASKVALARSTEDILSRRNRELVRNRKRWGRSLEVRSGLALSRLSTPCS